MESVCPNGKYGVHGWENGRCWKCGKEQQAKLELQEQQVDFMTTYMQYLRQKLDEAIANGLIELYG